MSSGVARRHRKRRQEWASQERWCRVTCASTMAWEVWQGRTLWVWEAMGPEVKMWSIAVERGAR